MDQRNRTEFSYPEGTPGAGTSGKYWQNLNESSQNALAAVERWIYQDNISLEQLGTNDLHPALLILRYLRANQFNVSKTITHIQKNIEWRRTMDIPSLVTSNPEQILGCTLEQLTGVFPHWHSGYDKTGRPVLYKQYGKFEAGKIKQLVGGKNFDPVVRYHLWEQEACSRLCFAQSIKTGMIVETISAVIDIKDMGMSQITSDFLKLTKAIAEIDQNQYPESLGRAFIINAPSAFPLVWRMVKPWLDPATVAKITVLGGPKDYIPVLQDFIGEENLPSNYGGTLPPLSPQVHPYAETMLSYPSPGGADDEGTNEEKTSEEFDPAVLEVRYPESTPGSISGNGKYFHQLSPASQDALTAVQQWVAREKFDLKMLGTSDLHPALLLLRYLRANQFNSTKTIAHLQKNLEWRKTKDIDVLITQDPEAVLGCTMEELTNVFPHWHSGYDKTGRPVLFKQYGKFDATAVKKLVGGNFDPIIRYHLWEQEACGRLCLAQTKKTGAIVETISAVIDIKDMGMSQITSDFLKLTKAIAEIDQNQYPESLGRAFIINAPSAFPLVWRMVKPWLDPATVAKITVLGGPKDYIPVLQDFIGEENLPSNYGGTLPPLSPQVHPYAETMLCLPVLAPPVQTVAKAGAVVDPFDPTVLTYRYPESTPGATPGNGKYFHQLSPSSQDALSTLEKWVAKEKFDLTKLSTADLHPALLLLRYLRANQFNATKTIAHLQKNLEWRKVKDINEINSRTPESILGCTMEELTNVFPHWHSGYDKTGRPVLFKQYGKFEAGLIKKLVGGNFEPVVRYHLWEQEACGRLCLAQSRKLNMIVETISAVIDIKDMGMSQITRDFLSLTKLLAEIDQNQYPETLGRAFIINAPSAFPLVWRMVKPWLDPATVAKITVLGGPKDYIPVLQDFIGEENLPSNYGGTLPPLSPQVHPYAETMLTHSTTEERIDEDARAAFVRVNDRNSFRNSLRNSFQQRRRRSLTARPAAEPAEQASSLWFYPTLLWNGIQRNWFDLSPEDDNESEWEGGSHRSESSEELDFSDAFESQQDFETNSHSHLYSAKPMEGTSTMMDKKRKRGWAKRFFLYRAFSKCYRVAVFDKSLRALSIQRLEMRFFAGACLHMLCAIACAGISATALAKIQWSASGTRLQLWAFSVVLLVSCFMIIFDLVGYYGLHSKNWPLLFMYTSGTMVGTLVFAAVTIAGFLYYSLPNAMGGGASLNSTLRENRQFMLVLAIGCLFVTVCATIPLVIARGVIIKLREIQGKHLQTRQIQDVLKIAQSISTIAAIVMLCYGSINLEYLLKIRYNAGLFPLYGLIYGGVSVLITSSIGVWVAHTVHRSVLRLYQYFILPFIVALLLVIALVSYSALSGTENNVHSSYNDLHTTESEEKIKATIQTLLLVTGTLTIFLCVFQTISLVATRALSSTIDSSGQVKEKMAILQAIKEKELGIYSTGGIVNGTEVVNKDTFWANFSVEHLGRLYMLYSRNQRDRVVIAWAIFMGLFNIFVCGTLAVFARNAAGDERQNSWMFSLLNLLGRADTRFIISNAYLRSTETILALLVGPALLFYAWSTFVYAPYRHVLGIMVTSSQMLIWLIYIVIESYAGYKHYQGLQEPVLLSFLIILGSLGYLIFPSWVLSKELIASTNDTSTSDSHELMMEANSETKPFMSSFDFDDLENGKYYDGDSPSRNKVHRNSDSSMEQILSKGTHSRRQAISPDPSLPDDASTASTRSFILSLGAEGSDGSTELELYRARAASAFRARGGFADGESSPPALYGDKATSPRSAVAPNVTTGRFFPVGSIEKMGGFADGDEKVDDDYFGAPAERSIPYPFPITPVDISRRVSPTRLRNASDASSHRPPTIPEDGQFHLYTPSGPASGPLPMEPAQDRAVSTTLRKRPVAPLRARSNGDNAIQTMMVDGVAAATAAMDPNKVLPMLMKMGVSSVEAAGMMTYLMRIKELSEGKRKKNSLAMVV